MNIPQLISFLLSSNKAGYAGGEEKKWIKESDASTTISYEQDEWKSHDNFFGGEPYGGRTVVFFKGKPVWMMVYYGYVILGIDVNEVYKVLRGALQRMPADYPFRGPKEFTDGDFIYTNSWEGNVERFSGEEIIKKGGNLIYKANYRGGLVDQQEGL